MGGMCAGGRCTDAPGCTSHPPPRIACAANMSPKCYHAVVRLPIGLPARPRPSGPAMAGPDGALHPAALPLALKNVNDLLDAGNHRLGTSEAETELGRRRWGHLNRCLRRRSTVPRELRQAHACRLKCLDCSCRLVVILGDPRDRLGSKPPCRRPVRSCRPRAHASDLW